MQVSSDVVFQALVSPLVFILILLESLCYVENRPKGARTEADTNWEATVMLQAAVVWTNLVPGAVFRSG